jgi:iron complex outermembrane recepter protein
MHCLNPIALAALAAAMLPTFAAAQATTLERVEVTGTPLVENTRVDAFGALTTEVGQAQVRDLNAIDLSAALRRTPGVAVSRFNPVGSFGGDEGGAVYVRGLGASRPGSEIRTYVDGIPFYMGVWNHALLDLLPVGGMDRISVHKGPQPQAFGDTFAAIDLAPRRAKQEGLAANLRVSGGSSSTLVEQADAAWRGGAAEFSIAQGHSRSDGHRPDADGRLDNLLARGSLALSPQWSVDALALGADNRVADPGVEGDPASKTGTFTTRGTLGTLSIAHAHGAWRGRLQVYDNQGTGHWDNPTAAVVHSTFHLSGLRWQEAAQPWQGGELAAGLDVDRMRGSVGFNGFTAFDGVSMRLSSPHVALAHTMAVGAGWTATPSAGVRLYRHDVYGSHSAPHAGLVVAQGDALALRVNAARGLSHPGLGAALLNAIVPPLAGAPDSWRDLKPERMDHVELGAHWAHARDSSLDLSVFDDHLKDRYVFAFPPTVPMPSLTNLGAYRVRGAELAWQQQWSREWSSFTGLTLLDSTLADLPYAPRRALAAGVTWQAGPWRVSADAQAQSRMFVLNKARADGASNTAEVGGFTVLNLRASHALGALGPRGEVFVALENLGDRRYAYRPGYPMPGLSGQLGVNLSL